MSYTAKIKLSDNINKESFIEALKDAEERYSDFGGIPIIYCNEISKTKVNICNIVGLCKSIDYNDINITFDLINPESSIITKMIRDNVQFILSPKMILTNHSWHKNNIINNIVNTVICICIKSV